jgi:hypothetical protein
MQQTASLVNPRVAARNAGELSGVAPDDRDLSAVCRECDAEASEHAAATDDERVWHSRGHSPQRTRR